MKRNYTLRVLTGVFVLFLGIAVSTSIVNAADNSQTIVDVIEDDTWHGNHRTEDCANYHDQNMNTHMRNRDDSGHCHRRTQ